MNKWIKAGALILALAAALWIVWWLVSFLVSMVISILQIAIALAVLALILYGAYLLVSKVGGSSGSGVGNTERERIYE